jgi:hypothetical protein
MTTSIMPCFGEQQARDEGIIIGRLLAGYGELELEMCVCVSHAMNGNLDAALRLVFGQRGAEQRIKQAREAMNAEYTKANLDSTVLETLADMDWCRKIRNQYAHAHWYYTGAEGLCFVNLEALVEQSAPIQKVTEGKYPIGLALLETQETYFGYVKECFWHLQHEFLTWAGRMSLPFARPPKETRPLLHN